jgi:hypothetical protein
MRGWCVRGSIAGIDSAVLVMTAVVLPALAGGCRSADHTGPICAPTLGEAIAVIVRDARTGAPLAAGARGAVQEGSYVDSLRPEPLEQPTARTLVGGGDRAGTYTVTVARVGAQPWQRTGVVVGRGACGVATVTLVANLEPNPRAPAP